MLRIAKKLSTSFVAVSAAVVMTLTSATEANATTAIHASRFTTLLNSLSVVATSESLHPGYARKLFLHWIDANNDGCNTREEVLKAESRVMTTQSITCKILSGRWYSAYDRQWVTNPTLLDIDHVVALKEAWLSGAYTWSYNRREAFANDLGYGPSLMAVTATSNFVKSSSDPAHWLPPVSYRCTYAASYVGIKWRWRLSVDSAEKRVLANILSHCSTVTVPLPRRA